MVLPDKTLAELVRVAADAVIIGDTHNNIIFWNDAAERIFGWAASEVVGGTLDVIIPERHRRNHADGYKRVMATGKTIYGDKLLRVPALRKDGTRISIAFTVTLLFDDEGRVASIAAVLRDETERWREEKELRRLLAG